MSTGSPGSPDRGKRDLMVMCRSRAEAERALAGLTSLLADLGLEPKPAKTRIVHLVEGARASTSSASTIAWCAPGAALGRDASSSLPAGPHVKRPSTPGIGSVSSRTGRGCWCRSKKSSGASIGFCAAGPGSSGSGTRLVLSTRSGAMRSSVWRSSWPTSTAEVGVGACATFACRRTTSGWSTSTDSSSHPGRTMPGGPSLPNTVGEGRR